MPVFAEPRRNHSLSSLCAREIAKRWSFSVPVLLKQKKHVTATPHVNIHKVERHRLDVSRVCATNTRGHCSRWSLPQDHGLCWWCDGISGVCTETQSMRQCFSRSRVARVKSVRAFRNSSVSGVPAHIVRRLAAHSHLTSRWKMCHSDTCVSPPERPLVCWDVPESKRRRSFILTSFVEIVDHSGCPDLLWLFDLTSIAHRQYVLSDSSKVGLFMHILVLFSWSWQWQG